MSVRSQLVCAMAGVFVLGCCGASAQVARTATPLENTHWKLEWIPGTKIESLTPQKTPFIELNSQSHRMSGSGGCNRLMGPYELEGDHLRFEGATRTMMACASGMKTEGALVDALDKVREWKVQGSTLSLMDADGHVLARFVAVPAVSSS